MKKLFFISIVALMVLAVFFIAGCQSEEDIAGEAFGSSYCSASEVGKAKCNIKSNIMSRCSKKAFSTSYIWRSSGYCCMDPDTGDLTKQNTINYMGQAFTDYCSDSDTIVEYFCGGTNPGELRSANFSCKMMGVGNLCRDGSCIKS
ncbi:MAG TPA: hypothetical protein VJC00_02135 [Candidatus Nanoarchaeia archaeon]|nr:hypothetical protein [Candidatus Nanoarchaeia archaeon]